MASMYRRISGGDRPSKRQDTASYKSILISPTRTKSPPTKFEADSITSNSPGTTTPMLAHDDPRTLWLSVLTQDELAQVATGTKWQSGDLHQKRCFVCKLGSMLLNCQHCSRTYHSTCLDPPIKHSTTLEEWTCPACALLNDEGATHIYVLTQPYERQYSRKMARVDRNPKLSHLRPFEMSKRSQDFNGYRWRQVVEIPEQNAAEQLKLMSQSPQSYRNGNTSVNRLSLDSESSSIVTANTGSVTNNSTLPLNSPLITQSRPSVDKSQTAKPDSTKPSRYSTLPADVDSALATLNRHLEAGIHSQNMLSQATARTRVLEQELKIERGKALLTPATGRRNELIEREAADVTMEMETEMKSLKIRFLNMERELNDTKSENQRLRNEAGDFKAKIQELELWKMGMKRMVAGDVKS